MDEGGGSMIDLKWGIKERVDEGGGSMIDLEWGIKEGVDEGGGSLFDWFILFVYCIPLCFRR